MQQRFFMILKLQSKAFLQVVIILCSLQVVYIKKIADGALYTFGYSAHGQLGLHTTVNQCLPQLVRDFDSIHISRIAAGWHHSLALTEKGDLYAAGHGAWGQLGLGGTDSMPSFIHVKSLGPKNIKGIYAGGDHSWVVLDGENPEKSSYASPPPLKSSSSPIPMKSRDDNIGIDDEMFFKMNKDVSLNSKCINLITF